MKKLVYLFLGLITSINIYSQDSIVNYLDRKYKKVPRSNAIYTQTIVKKDSLWLASVYYGNGKIKLQGKFKEKDLKNRVGSFKTFNEKGNLKSILKYNNQGKKDGIYLYFNEKGNQITRGYFLDNKKEGVWKFYYNKESLKAKIIYAKDKVVRYSLFNKDGTKKNEKLIFEQKAKYKGGIHKLRKKISNQLAPKLKGIRGEFIVKFYINIKGKVQGVTVDPKFPDVFKNKEKTIIKFFEGLPNWQPAIQLNSPVKVSYSIPLKLK